MHIREYFDFLLLYFHVTICIYQRACVYIFSTTRVHLELHLPKPRLKNYIITGASLGRVPWVPRNPWILKTYVLEPVDFKSFYKMIWFGTRKISGYANVEPVTMNS